MNWERIAIALGLAAGIFGAGFGSATLVLKAFDFAYQRSLSEFTIKLESVESENLDQWAAYCRLWGVSVQSPCPYRHKIGE